MKTTKLLFFHLLFVLFSGSLLSQTFPAGFSQVKIASLPQATAMRFAPDGRIFVCQRDGTVNIIKNGVLLSTPFVKLTTAQDGERGVSGITFDPNFNTNHYVYIYYTATTPTIHNRLSRFTASGDVAVPGSELALLDAEPLTAVYHNGGGLDFGKDGKLYLAMGEDNKPSNSQNMTTYKGKLLRLNSDGSAPSDNPYFSSTNPITQKIWCIGNRNPYTLSIHPVSGRIFVNNVGADYWEEIHDATSPGQNFGWPAYEGYSSDPAYASPIFAYPHDATGQHGCAVVGGTFFNPTSSNYPAEYNGKYFYMDFCNGWMWYFTPTATSHTGNTLFATGLTTQNLALQVGPDGNLYYLNRYDTKAGVYKIIYSGSGAAPAITSHPANVTVPAGQPASFSVSASGSMPLSYQWRKNGTDIPGATSSTYTISSTTASHAGSYSAKVSNTFGTVNSNAATLTITAFNNPPDASIITPAANSKYRAGDIITFSGNATDSEDGTLAASQFEWSVEFWHNGNHTHPGPYIPPGIKNGSFTIPNTGETSPFVFYRLKLKVTDSNGLIDTPHVDILPWLSTITMNTVPSGLQVSYDGQPKNTPFTTQAVRAMLIPIGAPSPQTKDGNTYAFTNWQQGGANPHTIHIGEGDSTYTAIFNETDASCASGSISRELWNNVSGTVISAVPVNTTPSSITQLNILETPAQIGDNYAQRIRGYICAPTTGSYTFWIASDNNSELWLSTTENPANKVKIASVSGYTAAREWTKYPSQKSAPITLQAEGKYYIEVLHKEGDRGDNLAVGWDLPSGTQERPIPGNRLSPFSNVSNTPPNVVITAPPNNFTYSSPANITITADASSASSTITKVEFFNGTTKIGEDLSSPYSLTWMNVTTGVYSLTAQATDAAGMTGTSQVVKIRVTTCTTPIITPAGPTTICSGSVLLKSNTGPGFMYQWKKNGSDISGATASSYTATSSGDYQVKIIQGSCISWSAPAYVRIESGLSASITPGGPTTFCKGQLVKLYANTCSGYTYQWRKNSVDIPGATASTYTVTSSGNYQVRVTLSGTHAWSAQLAVTVNNCSARDDSRSEGAESDETGSGGSETEESGKTPVSIEQSSDSIGEFRMTVFPNPNNGLFTIMVNSPTSKEEKVILKIVNVLGQEVYKKEFITNTDYIKETVELDGSLTTGVYTLQLMIGDKMESTSVVLAK